MTVADYWVTIVRDVMLTLISVYHTNRAVAASEENLVSADEGDTTAFMDFDMMLMSVLPHKYFALYLQQEKPGLQPYLQMIHIIRLYSEEGLVLNEKEKALELLVGVEEHDAKHIRDQIHALPF